MQWVQDIVLALKTPDVRKRILFVLFILGVFRIIAAIPVPGVESEALRAFFDSNQFFGILNIFSGGALSNLSIAMLGLGPYITATIILQLLTLVFPRLKEMYQESGEEGRRKFTQYGRMLSVAFAVIQGYALIALFESQGLLTIETPLSLITVLISVVAGSVLLMWLGELVSEKGIGNGISLLIFAGIIAAGPLALRNALATGTSQDVPQYIMFGVISLLIIIGVIIVNEARRNIPVSYAKQMRGSRLLGGTSSFLPLTLNPAGVIPIIFALSIIFFPSVVGTFLQNSSSEFLQSISNTLLDFTENSFLYIGGYFLLVVLFTFFYTAVTFNPKNVSENLQRQGGFIAGIRPGQPTAQYITFILRRTLLVGALFLGCIAVIPAIIQGGLQGGEGATSFVLGGTSVLIVVSVVLETMRQVRAQVGMRQYD
ncbi:MAG: preprotein translocase subunit SecY [Candidatus Spechtbacteria bacterium SB0662_bin_43]|uniref:Protein translocase subunit SecY n=1 Tax=Candidatus Spechtbacteria bacterium SB0662_bin_43 TaxID=2604897 RepID=A0A845DMB6_9BACT|nr:preprotein translocase subunit SecY [Candidatus Spechtbacteria bacterium SB0662_bin_43]